MGALTNNEQVSIPHNIINIDKILYYNLVGWAGSIAVEFNTYVNNNNTNNTTYAYVGKANVVVSSTVDRSTYQGYITIQYTKTTDQPISN